MATQMQKRAVIALVEKGGTVAEAMREAGYSENTLHTPTKLTESEGFQELMDVYLPEDKLLRALEDDIDGKPLNRKAELELAFKLRGRLKESSDGSKTVNLNFFNDEQTRRIAARVLNGGTTSS
jgi:hypothetical protein